MKVLKINSSARYEDSFSRGLVDKAVDELRDNNPELEVIDRDLAKGLSLLAEKHIAAFYTPADERSPEQKVTLTESDELVGELVSCDMIVIGAPIYNFGVPASLKAWADLVARVGLTFKYGEEGPIGLVKDKPVYLIVTSGGTQVGSDIDFASVWLKHFLKFLGITNVQLIDSGQIIVKGEDVVKTANDHIEQIQF